MCLIYIKGRLSRAGISPGAEAGNFAVYEIHMLISPRHSFTKDASHSSPIFTSPNKIPENAAKPRRQVTMYSSSLCSWGYLKARNKNLCLWQTLRISPHNELVPCWVADRYAEEVACSYAKCVLFSKGKWMSIKSHVQNSRHGLCEKAEASPMADAAGPHAAADDEPWRKLQPTESPHRSKVLAEAVAREGPSLEPPFPRQTGPHGKDQC